ncbi:MAG: chromosome condensation protein [Eubacterium sp.]|nr:chromosome condensation protein [Eubacterium sp.]
MKTYPLTPAQNMHNIWIHDYGTQQVSGLSIVVALKAPIEFDILEKCIRLTYRRFGCMRLQFTKPDESGSVMQYLAPKNKNFGKIERSDLSGLSGEEADGIMQDWAYVTFDGDDIPMCEFKLVSLPGGYRGFFLHMDHRLIDSAGLVGIVGDIFAWYAHEVLGADEPGEPADFVKVLENDLTKQTNKKRVERDNRFWMDMLDSMGEPLYSDICGQSVLDESRKRHGDKSLRAADVEMKDLFVKVKDYYLEEASAKRVMKFCDRYQLSPTNLLLLTLRTYLSKVNGGQEDITIQNFISRRSTVDEWSSGGSRTIMFPCRTIITPDTEFLNAAYEIQTLQNRIYMHGNYDPGKLSEEFRRRYHTPEHTAYESCYLTYQPVSMGADTTSFKGIPMYIKWFANGAATKKMYLTVSHPGDGTMRFSYHYQTAHLSGKDIELLYYYMMKIMFKGINEPDITIGALMKEV